MNEHTLGHGPGDALLSKHIYHFAPDKATRCQHCNRFMHRLREIPSFYFPACEHWFHHECLVLWLTSDTNTQSKCNRCSKLHYNTRWTGRTVCRLRDRYPNSQLPNIGVALTRTEIETQLIRVKDRQRQSIIPGGEFVMEPETFLNSGDKNEVAEIEAEMEEVEQHRDKLGARLREVIKYRRERAILKRVMEKFK